MDHLTVFTESPSTLAGVADHHGPVTDHATAQEFVNLRFRKFPLFQGKEQSALEHKGTIELLFLFSIVLPGCRVVALLLGMFHGVAGSAVGGNAVWHTVCDG